MLLHGRRFSCHVFSDPDVEPPCRHADILGFAGQALHLVDHVATMAEVSRGRAIGNLALPLLSNVLLEAGLQRPSSVRENDSHSRSLEQSSQLSVDGVAHERH